VGDTALASAGGVTQSGDATVSQNREPGQILTFYSYKGGTGRSMALANVGCLLTRRPSSVGQNRVLLVDWDLEAPGLHRFFEGRLGSANGDSPDSHPGLIDIFSTLRRVLATLPAKNEEAGPDIDAMLRQAIPLDEYVIETAVHNLHFMSAGRFDEKYARCVNAFRWNSLNSSAPWLFTWFGNYVAESYQYVLIDSRTGITDTSGICTSILPEKLITVFTPNRQSLDGVLDLARRAISYRRKSDDLRPLLIFPLPSRIEPTMERLRRFWRSDPEIGYQPRFESLVREAYGISTCDLTSYFDDIQIQQVPDYAYGEGIAVLDENTVGDRLSLARSYEAFVGRLTNNSAPWEPPSTNYSSVFISYSEKDREFAQKLQADLARQGIRTWHSQRELDGDNALYDSIKEAIRSSDKVLLILSKNSIQSPWVQKEVESAFEKEREGTKLVLLPIRIDDAVFSTNTPPMSDIRRLRHISDFSGWTDPDGYMRAFNRLLSNLATSNK
jgi:MinD-like ATPase involved in chromosome partitioning or flagellar assembly